MEIMATIVAQAFGHNYGLSNSFNNGFAHPKPLSVHRSHYGNSPSLVT